LSKTLMTRTADSMSGHASDRICRRS
jgi:hypothetical protein